jgi:DUF2971 family protein
MPQHDLDLFWRDYDSAVNVPMRLCHYTDLPALASIVDKSEMWCSNVAFSNDPSEVAHGQKLIVSVVEEVLPPSYSTTLVFTIKQFDYFAIALSIEPDSLPQWRAYCDNGRGVALAFDTHLLAKVTGLELGRVEYDAQTQEALVREVVELYRQHIEVQGGGVGAQFVVGAEPYALALLRLAGIFKNPAYATEQEYRLFKIVPKVPAYHDRKVEFRPTRSAIVPYFPVSIKYEESVPLSAVIVGPCLDFELIAPTLRLFLQSRGCRAEVRASEVKMRST